MARGMSRPIDIIVRHGFGSPDTAERPDPEGIDQSCPIQRSAAQIASSLGWRKPLRLDWRRLGAAAPTPFAQRHRAGCR